MMTWVCAPPLERLATSGFVRRMTGACFYPASSKMKVGQGEAGDALATKHSETTNRRTTDGGTDRGHQGTRV